jgi:hypothetical protein
MAEVIKKLTSYQKKKIKNTNISNFINKFFRVFSVIKRYERGNIFKKQFGLRGFKEEGEPVDAYDYDIGWALGEIGKLTELVGLYSSDIEDVFLPSFNKIMEELKARALKLVKVYNDGE